MTRIVADWLISPASQQVCAMLTDAGHQAWFVGGCVRNALIGAPVADLDLATDAHPKDVMALGKAAGLRVVPTGIDHGTITLIVHDTPFEVTTFRRDVETDGRHAIVAFADTLAADAARRDFTMNALYAGPDGVVVDPVGGLPDLQARKVRFIGDAHARIKEDYLRILRFFRFYAWYGDADNGIDADGLAACAEHVEGIAGLSRERVGQEMLKLLSAPDPAPAVAAMAACGALAQVLPGATANILPVLVHVESEAGLAPDPIRRLAVLGGDKAAAALRLSNAQADHLALMTTQSDASELGYRHGADTALDILAVQAAIFGREIEPDKIKFAQFGAVQTFPLRAADLMPALDGPALGRALKDAEMRWIASGFSLTKADLLR